jgi:hypothetical protein
MAANRPHRPDPSTADRLVAGRIGADDAPPGYRRAAALLGDAGSGFPDPAADAEATTVSAMVAAIQAEPIPQLAPRRSTMLRKVLAAKTVAIVSVLALSASGAAAATGNLPDHVQDKVANAAKVVGLNIPHGVKRVECTVGNEAPARNRGQYLKQVRELNDEAALAEAKESRCGMPVNSKETPGADEADETPETEGQSGKEHGKAGKEHGKAGDDQGETGAGQGAPTDTPAPVETPNEGGIGTGSTASDDANATGAGAAADGSDNADEHPTVEDTPAVENTPAPTLPTPNS